ncbi:enhancer of mRNA-decapping protein 4 [Tachysurus ichikawai]
MASSSNIDIEGATQHLRDILKLDRPTNSTENTAGESQRKTSCNGELNGLLGTDLIGAGVLSAVMDPTIHSSDNINMADTQTM